MPRTLSLIATSSTLRPCDSCSRTELVGDGDAHLLAEEKRATAEDDALTPFASTAVAPEPWCTALRTGTARTPRSRAVRRIAVGERVRRAAGDRRRRARGARRRRSLRRARWRRSPARRGGPCRARTRPRCPRGRRARRPTRPCRRCRSGARAAAPRAWSSATAPEDARRREAEGRRARARDGDLHRRAVGEASRDRPARRGRRRRSRPRGACSGRSGAATSTRSVGDDVRRAKARSAPLQVAVTRNRPESTRAPATTGVAFALGHVHRRVDPRADDRLAGGDHAVDGHRLAGLHDDLLAGAHLRSAVARCRPRLARWCRGRWRRALAARRRPPSPRASTSSTMDVAAAASPVAAAMAPAAGAPMPRA